MARDINTAEIVNWSTMPDAQPVGQFYKTKKGAQNYLFRVFIGPHVSDLDQWEVEVVKQPTGEWVPFIRERDFPIKEENHE